jgi:hypothetical protein
MRQRHDPKRGRTHLRESVPKASRIGVINIASADACPISLWETYRQSSGTHITFSKLAS